MLINKNYCDYEICVALRELGYNYPQRLIPDYFGVFEEPQYDEKIHLYDAQKWLREKHNLHIEITYSPSCWTGKIYDLKEWDYIKGFTFFESFEDALHTLIKEAIKILKEK
jgi:hypothetical protein